MKIVKCWVLLSSRGWNKSGVILKISFFSYSPDLDSWLSKGFYCLRTHTTNKDTQRLVSRSNWGRRIHCLTIEFHLKVHLKNRYRTYRLAIRAILVFQVKFKVEFTLRALNISIVFACVLSVSVWKYLIYGSRKTSRALVSDLPGAKSGRLTFSSCHHCGMNMIIRKGQNPWY